MLRLVGLLALAAAVAADCASECEGAASCSLSTDRTTRTCTYTAGTGGSVRPPTGATVRRSGGFACADSLTRPFRSTCPADREGSLLSPPSRAELRIAL